MKNYNIIFYSEKEKYNFVEKARAAGAIITGVSGYYSGYYIQFDANNETIKLLEKDGF